MNLTGMTGGTLTSGLTAGTLAGIFDNDNSGFVSAPFKYVALGVNDASALLAFHTESQRRYLPPIQSGFRVFTAFSGDYTAARDFGSDYNYEHISCLALNNGLTTEWEAAAIVAGAAVPALYASPVASLEGKPLPGLKSAAYYSFEQANSLLYGGMSVLQVSRDGSCSIKRLISMYLHRPDNSLDDAFLDINTAETLERIRYTQRLGAIQRFVGTAAAKNPEGYRPGLRITTVDDVIAYLLVLYKDTLMREYGWVQDYEFYKSQLLVEQDPTNPSRFNYKDAPVILSPFYILAGRSQFRKVA